MSVNLEQAKRLKISGFPQGDGCYYVNDAADGFYRDYRDSTYPQDEERYFSPTEKEMMEFLNHNTESICVYTLNAKTKEWAVDCAIKGHINDGFIIEHKDLTACLVEACVKILNNKEQ